MLWLSPADYRQHYNDQTRIHFGVWWWDHLEYSMWPPVEIFECDDFSSFLSVGSLMRPVARASHCFETFDHRSWIGNPSLSVFTERLVSPETRGNHGFGAQTERINTIPVWTISTTCWGQVMDMLMTSLDWNTYASGHKTEGSYDSQNSKSSKWLHFKLITVIYSYSHLL